MFTKRIMNMRYALNVGQAICLFAAVYLICHKLRQHGVSLVSIDSAWNWFTHWTRHFHLLAVALLPVYVALMVFGTAAAAIYLGSLFRRLIK